MATRYGGESTASTSLGAMATAKHHDYFPACGGRPLRTVPVTRPASIATGDHIIFQINSSNKYRPMYRSALVESTSDGNVRFIAYTSDGLQRQVQPFTSFKSLHKVDYTFGAMSGDVAVNKAKERLGECYYHGLFNNSHHFVSWAKTGLEYSLTDLVHGVEGEIYLAKSYRYRILSNYSVKKNINLIFHPPFGRA